MGCVFLDSDFDKFSISFRYFAQLSKQTDFFQPVVTSCFATKTG